MGAFHEVVYVDHVIAWCTALVWSETYSVIFLVRLLYAVTMRPCGVPPLNGDVWRWLPGASLVL